MFKNFRGNKVKVKFSHYRNNNSLAATLVTDENEIYAVVSKNLPYDMPNDEKCVFLDENNITGIGEWLEKNGYGTLTGNFGTSGYCVYPEFRFNEVA